MKPYPLATLATLPRASLFFAALCVGAAIAPVARAADQPAQQVAMANTQARDPGKVLVAQRTPRVQRTNSDATPTRRANEARSVVATRDSDGSRFLYDSCGCSND